MNERLKKSKVITFYSFINMTEVLQPSSERNTKIKAILHHFGVNLKGLSGNDLTYENAQNLYKMGSDKIKILEQIRNLKGKDKTQFIDDVIEHLNITVPSRGGSKKTTAQSSPEVTPMHSDHGGGRKQQHSHHQRSLLCIQIMVVVLSNLRNQQNIGLNWNG